MFHLDLSRSRALACASLLLLTLHGVSGSSGPAPDPPALISDLAITSLTAAPSPGAMVGTNITYTIGYINNGPDTPGSSSAKLTVPANTTFVSRRVVSGTDWGEISTPPVGGTGDVIWRKGSPGSGAAPAETAQFEVVVKVNASTR
jgi:uncharacterized repeat protein (TIGR01451 family)